jgi:hypothetical protein
VRSVTKQGFFEVRFEGTRSGEFPLTWGQLWVWNSVTTRAPHYADLSGSYVVPVPDGRDQAAVSDALTGLLDKYETFRTRYSTAPDGTLHQVIAAHGDLRVEVRVVDAVDVSSTASGVNDERRCAAAFPEADALVFGHSHIPWDSVTDTGLRLLNPGSPTDRRRQPEHTYLTAYVRSGELSEVTLHTVPGR